jgi:uncharacterized protein (TIGR00296 family)
MMFSDKDGKQAVRIARAIIESHVNRVPVPKMEVPDVFTKKYGVFVTITTHPNDDLRGCIGYPEPILPLIDALKDAAISACSRDPRFPPVTSDELDKVKVEVSLLTPPEEIKVKKQKELTSHISVGVDGLIMERGWARGLLLPQVPVEWGWNVEEFLCQTCMKAGLSPDAWLQSGTKVFKFQAEVFSEVKPRGEAIRRSLSD